MADYGDHITSVTNITTFIMTKTEILSNLITDRLTVLRKEKERLEEQITKDTSNEIELPEQFADQRREKLAEVIKEIKILDEENT